MADEAQIILPEGEYAKYLANLAAELADAKIHARETRWRAVVGAIISAVALLGYANLSSINGDLQGKLEIAEARLSAQLDKSVGIEVKSYIDNNRAELVGDTLDKVQSDLEARLSLLQLVIAAAELRESDSFSNEARGAVVSLLQTVSQNDELVSSPQFAKPLEDIVQSFLAADQETYIDNIDDKLRNVISDKSGITASMIHHYGLRVLGAVEPHATDVGRLMHYARTASDSFNSPEDGAPYLLGLAFRQAGYQRDPVGEGIFADAGHWPSADRNEFLRLATVLRDGKFHTESTGKTDRVESLMARVFVAYGKEFSAMSKVPGSFNEEAPQIDELLDRIPSTPGDLTKAQ